jgi:hypothetical protein
MTKNTLRLGVARENIMFCENAHIVLYGLLFIGYTDIPLIKTIDSMATFSFLCRQTAQPWRTAGRTCCVTRRALGPWMYGALPSRGTSSPAWITGS